MQEGQETYYIYGLIDPRDNRLRYVGASKNLKRRYKEHLCSRNVTKLPVYVWIKELFDLKLRPAIRILEKVDSTNWKEKERLHIKKYRNKFTDLTNVSDGGNGAYENIPEYISKKLSTGMKGKHHSEETKIKISIGGKGLKRSEETKQKLSSALKAHVRSPEHTEKIAQANRGRKHSEEARKNMSLAGLGRVATKETRAKLRNGWTDERREAARKRAIEYNNIRWGNSL